MIIVCRTIHDFEHVSLRNGEAIIRGFVLDVTIACAEVSILINDEVLKVLLRHKNTYIYYLTME